MRNNAFKDWKPSEHLTPEVLSYYRELIKKGDIERAANYIALHYPREVFEIIKQERIKILNETLSRELTTAEINGLKTDLAFVMRNGKNAILNGVRVFTTHVIAKVFFKENGISKKKLQKAILEGTLGQFEDYINGAMSQTQPEILSYIRKIQQEWIIRNQTIHRTKDMARILRETEAEFRDRLRRKFPRYFDLMEDGKILKSRIYGNNKFRTYTLEEYTDFSVRATILNIDRNSVEISAHSKSHRVVEYYLRDTRPIKTEERLVCDNILKKKIRGKSLLALDDKTAQALGIMTIEQARNLGAMYIHCRHSIKKLSDEFNKQVEKIIYLSKQSAEKVFKK